MCVLEVGTTVEGQSDPALMKVTLKCWRIQRTKSHYLGKEGREKHARDLIKLTNFAQQRKSEEKKKKTTYIMGEKSFKLCN